METAVTFGVVFQIVLTLAGVFGGIFIRRLQQDNRDFAKAIERIRDEYQRREDARHNHTALMDTMRDLRAYLERIEDKLDRKADK